MKKRIIPLLLVVVMMVSMTTTFSISTAADTGRTEPGLSSFQEELSDKYADPDREYSTEVRWWLGTASATTDTLRESIQEMYDGGFRGVELCMQSASGSAPNATYAYGTDQWAYKWKMMMNEILDLGMTLSLTSGTNWSTHNVPGLDPDSQESSQVIAMSKTRVTSGATATVLVKPGTTRATNKGRFVGAYAYKFVKQESRNVAGRYNYTYTSVEPDTIIDLSKEGVTFTQGATVYDQTFSWTAPDDGEYVIFAYWTHGNYVTASPSAQTCYAVNYFDKDQRGLGALRNFWEAHYLDDPVLNQKILKGDVQLFMDSLELNPTGGITWWTEDFRDEFIAFKGYDIMPYLFVVEGLPQVNAVYNAYFPPAQGSNNFEGDDAFREKIVNDWVDFLTKSYMDNFLYPLKSWLNNVGIKTRAQISYGRSFEMTEPAMAVDYPETEGFNQYNQIDIYRLHGAGGKLQNKVVSAETGTEIGVSGATHQMHMRDAYYMYSAGITRFIWHIWAADYGYGTNIAWPGDAPGSSGFYRFSNRDPNGLKNYDEFNAHLGRISQLLRTGKSRTDIGFIHNNWNQGVRFGGSVSLPGGGGSGSQNPFTGMNWMLAHQGIYYRSTELQDNGYTYDYFSPKFLFNDEVYFDEDTKTIEMAGYKALVLYQRWLDIAGAKKILEYAKKGLPVFIMDGAAVQTPFNDGKDDDLAGIIAEMKELDNVRSVAIYDATEGFDYFLPIAEGYEDGLYEALQEMGIRPYAEFTEPNKQLLTQSRQDEDGNMYLYVFNYCDNGYHSKSYIDSVKTLDHGTNIKTEIKMDGVFIPYAIDAFSGEVTELAEYYYDNGQTVFPVDVDCWNAQIFAFEAVDESKLHVVSTEADSAYIDASGLGVRATKSGTYKTTLSSGEVLWNTVRVPAAYDITGWDVTVESWTAGANGSLQRSETLLDTTTVNSKAATIKTNINVQLPTMTTWNNIPGVGRNISGLGYYKATFNWDAGKASGAYLDLGKTESAAKVWINGVKVGGDASTNPTKATKAVSGTIDGVPAVGKDLYSGGINWVKPVVDISDYLVDGENKIVIEDSSDLTNVMLSMGRISANANARGWYNNTVAYREYGFSQAVIVPYVDSSYVPTTFTLADPSITKYEANAPFDVIVTTGADATKVKIVNELGNVIGKLNEVVTKNDDGTKSYRITLMIGTPGDRTLSAMVMGQIGDYQDVKAGLDVTIVKAAPVQNTQDIISATAPGSAGVNTPFTVTVVTSKDITKVKIVGETGASIGILSSSVVTNGNTKTWTISIKVGSKGNRTLTALGAGSTGGYGTDGKSFNITIK